MIDPSKLDRLPATFQAVSDYFAGQDQPNPFALRREMLLRMERTTGRPLICYVTRTSGLPRGGPVPAYIDDSDLTGFGDLLQSVQGEAIDVLVVSNGGSAEAAERIVRLIRQRFKTVRFLLPANAYSAATLMSFSGDDLVMNSLATLGPIDPQLNGVPVYAILKAFETVEERLKKEGPKALTAYMPLLAKYDLHILELCKSAQELSKELARTWLSAHMLKWEEGDPRVTAIVDFFSNYPIHKSHGRSIDRDKARELGLSVTNAEDVEPLGKLMRRLHSQYELWFGKTSFYKVFENAHGINWGRQFGQTVMVPVPSSPARPRS